MEVILHIKCRIPRYTDVNLGLRSFCTLNQFNVQIGQKPRFTSVILGLQEKRTNFAILCAN